MPPRGSLSQNVVNGILAWRLGVLYKRVAKTNLFNFIRLDAVLANVFNVVLRLNELIDCHTLILGHGSLRKIL